MTSANGMEWAREGSDELSTDIIDRLSILSLLAEYHRQQCVDPRDKIYALLGISHPYDGAKLDISYSISVEQLYLDVAKHIIHGSRRLDILLFCRRASLVVLGTAASINLPSVCTSSLHPSSKFSRLEARPSTSRILALNLECISSNSMAVGSRLATHRPSQTRDPPQMGKMGSLRARL